MAFRPKETTAAGIADLVRVNGAGVPGAVLDIRSLVGPASYATGGEPVDLSAAFSSIRGIQILRAYTTTTKQGDGRLYRVVETGTDTFANRKFRMFVEVPRPAYTPAGTVAAPVFTGAAVTSNQPSSTASIAADTHNHVFTGGAVASGGPSATVTVWAGAQTGSGVCIATCNNNHPGLNPSATATPGSSAHTHTTTAAGTLGGPSAVTNVASSSHTHDTTATGTNSAPAFTGAASPQAVAEELTAATNLSTVTVEYLVIGVPV